MGQPRGHGGDIGENLFFFQVGNNLRLFDGYLGEAGKILTPKSTCHIAQYLEESKPNE
jgi:hypothetical protein